VEIPNRLEAFTKKFTTQNLYNAPTHTQGDHDLFSLIELIAEN